MKSLYEKRKDMLLSMLVTDPVKQLPRMDKRYLRCSDAYITKLMSLEPCYLHSTKVKSCSRHFEGYIIGYGHFGVPKGYSITKADAYRLLINDLSDLEMRLHYILRGRLNLISTSRWEALLDIMFTNGPQALISSKLFHLIEMEYENNNTDFFYDIVRAFHAPEFIGVGADKTKGRKERCDYRADLWIKNRNYDV